MMTPPTPNKVCAIIVTYQPDTGFTNRLEKVVSKFPLTIIVNNSTQSLSKILLQDLISHPKIIIIENQSNLGIAAALNQGVKMASQLDYAWVVTLDQDTLISDNMLETLLTIYSKSGEVNVIIGCNYWDEHRKWNFIPCTENSPLFLKQKTLITSGTLLPLSLFKSIGFFREDYFIDSVDHEFCLRAKSNGYKILISSDSIMTHCIGSEVENPSKLRKLMSFNHSPVRKYYIARNTVTTAKLYFIQEPLWSIRQGWRLLADLASIILFEDDKIKKSTAFVLGFSHGVIGKMGPIEKTWPSG